MYPLQRDHTSRSVATVLQALLCKLEAFREQELRGKALATPAGTNPRRPCSSRCALPATGKYKDVLEFAPA